MSTKVAGTEIEDNYSTPYVTRPSSNGSQVSVMSMDSIEVF